MATRVGRKRVVVTGLGLVTPLGVGVERVWRALLGKEVGISRLGAAFDGLPCAVAAAVPRAGADAGARGAHGFDERAWVDASQARSVAPFTAFALAAAQQALADARFATGPELSRAASERCGVAFGSGIGSMQDIVDAAGAMAARGHRRVSPFFVPRALVNMAAGQIALRHGLRGPCHSAATACATGAHSIGDAYRMIMYGDADLVVAGASEAAITPLAIAGFCRLAALSTAFNDAPERASRPFDRARDGFVMGEGSGALVLESLEHALARGVGSARPALSEEDGADGGVGCAPSGGGRIYAEIVGYGLSCDAHHITSPPPDGDGALRCMAAALADARLPPRAVDYISAHATSTPVGDEIELRAITQLLQGCERADGKVTAVSSTKGATGHLLGAAGAIEAAFSVLAVHRRVAPPGVNLDDPVTLGETATLEQPVGLDESVALRRAVLGDVTAGERVDSARPPPSPPNTLPPPSPDGGGGLLELIVEPRALGGEGTRGAGGCADGGQPSVVALSNSFGFGGTNASLVFQTFTEDGEHRPSTAQH